MTVKPEYGSPETPVVEKKTLSAAEKFYATVLCISGSSLILAFVCFLAWSFDGGLIYRTGWVLLGMAIAFFIFAAFTSMTINETNAKKVKALESKVGNLKGSNTRLEMDNSWLRSQYEEAVGTVKAQRQTIKGLRSLDE